jgi:tellurite resistance protein TerC
MGHDKMLEFVTGYVVEKSLSVDNMFVFLLIFSSLGVPHAMQHRVLSVGILSAIAMRIPLIIVGVSLLETFHWMIFVFGGMLLLTAARMIVRKKKIGIEKNLAVRILKKGDPCFYRAAQRQVPQYEFTLLKFALNVRQFAPFFRIFLSLLRMSQVVRRY